MRFPAASSLVLILLPLLAVVSLLLYLSTDPNQAANEDTASSATEPIAEVEAIKLHKGQIEETLTAYGAVLPLPDKLKTISVPYTSRIDKIQVNQGQTVQEGDLLITLKPGADAVLQLEQAQRELRAALRNNQLLRERIRLKLATQQDLLTSSLRVEQAKIMLKNLADRGIGKEQQIHAESSGIIFLVNVQQGQIVAAGTPLLQLVDNSQWVVRLGIETEDYAHIQLNQPVLITPVNTPVAQPVKGHIEIITHQIDPSTRMVNVFIRPELNRTLLINDFVEGRIIISNNETLVVPRQAVLPDDGGYSLFTVVDGRAVKHDVKVGLENGAQIEVIADDLNVGDDVVVLGNYELEPGMAVAVTPSEGSGQQQ